MRTLFFGTPSIAVPAFEALCTVSEVVAVVCRPDRPAGRGLTLRPPPVKGSAERLGIALVQPDKIRSRAFVDWVVALDVELAVVMAYGRILPPALLQAPRLGCVNLHASLLPRYRGAAPINWAVVLGETETGISLMQMDEGCDTGPVLSRHPLAIGPDETAGELADRLADLAAQVVCRDLPRLFAGELEAVPQDDSRATAAPMLTRTDGLIRWAEPAGRVHDLARGMTPWPGAHTTLGPRRLKVLQTRLAARIGALGAPGAILAIDERGAEVACGDGSVCITRAQLEGKKPMSAAELARGRQISVGMLLGSDG